MNFFAFVFLISLLCAGGYALGYRRATYLSRAGNAQLWTRPVYHGLYVALWSGVSGTIVLVGWVIFEPFLLYSLLISLQPDDVQMDSDSLEQIYDVIRRLASGEIRGETPSIQIQTAAQQYASLMHTVFMAKIAVISATALGLGLFATRHISLNFRSRTYVETSFIIFLIICSAVAILTTIGIIISLVFDAIRFFTVIPIQDFLFGLSWVPQRMEIPLDNGAVDTSAFGAIPIFWGTIFISLIAMCVAVPVGLFAAIYMSEYASERFRTYAKPILEILAGVPTVVYGFFAALTVAPAIKSWGIWDWFNIGVSPENALAAGLVMGVMLIPFVSSLSDDVMNAVPQSLREGAYGLGATKSETICGVVLPAALPGIVGAIMLAISRAIGETMIVVMAAGLTANLTANPLDSVTTVTVQIVKLLTGDQQFDSAKTLSAFALGLVLFFITLTLNLFALHVVQKYREHYE